MEKLSVSLEDYIEEIYSQVLKNGNAKVTDIAAALNVRKASVTGALNALSDKKLIKLCTLFSDYIDAKRRTNCQRSFEKTSKYYRIF